MIINSIAHILESVLQYIALIIALLLYSCIKEVSSFSSSSHATRKPDHHVLKSRSTHALIREELFILYQWVRRLRKRHNLTQEKMAEKLGVDTRTVQRWENGTRPQPRHYSTFQQLERGNLEGATEEAQFYDGRSYSRRHYPRYHPSYHLLFLHRRSLLPFLLGLFMLIALLVFLILHFWLHIV